MQSARTAVGFSPPRVRLPWWHWDWEEGPARTVVGSHCLVLAFLVLAAVVVDGHARGNTLPLTWPKSGHSPGGSTTTEGGGGCEERDGLRTNVC